MKQKAFTLIELIIAITIVAVLSSIVMFSVLRYIDSGKDSSVSGNLTVLIPSGEVYYNTNSESYGDFCDSSVVENAISQMPDDAEVYCTDGDDQWVACAIKFTDPDTAFCVDSRGYRRDIDATQCYEDMSPAQCPLSGL